jgi:hypothetical protein
MVRFWSEASSAASAGNGATNLARLNPDGTLDSGFNASIGGSVRSLAIQADGKIIVGHWGFLELTRLNMDGTLDSGFDSGVVGQWGFVSLALQTDGKILVAGDIEYVGYEERNHIGRLNNTEAATQSLDCEASKITWMRGGTSPEWRVVKPFDF